MNGIIGMSNIALSNLDNEAKVRSCLNKILTASDHLLSLINEILDMSRIESGKLRLKEEEVHLPSMIASILEFINPEVERKSLELQMKSQVLEYDTVLSDSLHLQKILLNLLSNAVKYTPEGGKISLKIEEKQMRDGKMQICFVVADSGIGMTQEFMERIFQPFERAEDSRSSRIAGTGLGMAIVKSIVDMMGGEIRVESRTGQGSTFTVTLPMKYVSGEVCGIQELTGVPVLIADDEQDACESLSLILTEAGVNADWVLSGEDAVARVRKAHEQGQDFYAVILDWKMPTMDGIETARLIREITGNRTTILLLSAYDWENVEEEAIRIGINGFLTKPIFKNQLLRKLKHYARYHTGNGAVQVSPWEMRDGPDLSRAEILIAEDNELNLEIITEFLTSYGARVVCAGDGSEAVRCFQESAPGEYQMIFMDIHMPKMDGLEAARCIRASSHPDAEKVPIIAMTADVFSKDTNIFETAGMDAYVGKPINIDRLIEVLYEFSGK